MEAKPGHCEEALPFHIYIPCNKEAAFILYSKKDRRYYRMCEACADHNERRGMKIMGTFVQGHKNVTFP